MNKVQSVDKALRILQCLDAENGWLGVRELARRVDLTPANTHNLLNTLRVMSFVEYNADLKHYRLGLAAMRLGSGADPLNQIRLFARPYIEALANEFDETVAVLVWDNDQAIAVDWIQAEHPLAVTHNHGVIEHPIALASGRILLAYQSRSTQLRYAAREKLHEMGPNTPVTTDDLLDLLQKIAAQGFAVTKNVSNSGIAAVGAPVFDATGKLLMAVGCSEPISRSSDAHLEAVRHRLLEITATMSKRMGGTGRAASA